VILRALRAGFPRRSGILLLLLGVAVAHGLVACDGGAIKSREAQVPARSFEMLLWPDGPPSSNGLSGPEVLGACVSNISTATLTVYLPDPSIATGAALLILPGGGYGFLCVEREGWDISAGLSERGVAAIVLKYRLPNGHPAVPGDDARRALRTVRYRAAEWGIDPERVGIWGFSAGAHLAGTVASASDSGHPQAQDPVERESSRPDVVALFYPVVTMEAGVTHALSRQRLLGDRPASELVKRYCIEQQVDARFPSTFIMHCSDDSVVPIENSLRLRDQLEAHGVEVQLLVFERGGHGTNVLQRNPTWLDAFDSWLRAEGWE